MSSASLWTTDRSASNSASRSSVAVSAARTRSLAAVTVSLTAATSPRIECVMADTSSEIALLRSMRGRRSSSVRWNICSSRLPAARVRAAATTISTISTTSDTPMMAVLIAVICWKMSVIVGQGSG